MRTGSQGCIPHLIHHRQNIPDVFIVSLNFAREDENQKEDSPKHERKNEQHENPGRGVQHKDHCAKAQDCYRYDIKNPLHDDGGETLGDGCIIIMLEQDHPDQVSKPGWDDKVYRL